MDKNNSNIIEINIKDLIHTLLRRSWLIIIAGILSAASAKYYCDNYLPPYYTSSAKLYITSQEEGQITTLTDLQIGTYLTRDYAILVKSRPVADEVVKRLKLNISSGQLMSMVSVFTPEDSRILQITVTYYDRNLVKSLVDMVAQVSSERMESIMGERVNVLEEGYIPGGPSGPNIRKNILLAGGAGVLITTVLIALIFLFNDSIRTAEDIEKHLGLTTLGFIPTEASIKRKSIKKEKKKKAA